MRTQTVTKVLIAANAANIAGSQTPAATSFLTLTSSPVTLDTQRRVLVTYGDEAANRTLLITGTNQSGVTIQETVAIPSGASGTVATNQDFLTVTSIYNPGSSGFTAALTVGTNTTGSTLWQATNAWVTRFSLGILTTISGSVTYSIEYTLDELEPTTPGNVASGAAFGPLGALPPICVPVAVANMSGLSAGATGESNVPAYAWRLTVTAGTGSVTARGLQAGDLQT